MSRIIICGAGQVGFQIAKQLASEGKDVAVIDNNAALIAKVADLLDVRGVVGHASHPEVLERAGCAEAELLIAATYADEVNMVACSIAHSLFQVPTKIARVRSQEYLRPEYQDAVMGKNMPIDVVISPEAEIARVVLQRLGSPTAFDSAAFFEGRLQMIGARATEEALGAHTQLKQFETLFPNTRMMIFAYVRDGKLYAADGDDQFFPGDEVYFAVEEARAPRALEIVGQKAEKVARVAVIIGGGNIGVRVAGQLERVGMRPKVIERNRERAERAAELLERTIVFHGDGLSSELLREAGVEEAEAVIALTDDDKVNVLACALAKSIGARRALALTNDTIFLTLAEPLNIDAFFSPRGVTVSTILRHVRHGPISMVHSVRDGAGEIVEAEVLATSKVAGKRLRDIEAPASARICGVFSGGKIVSPSDDLVLKNNDRLVMFALKRDIAELYHLFQVSHMY